MIVRRFLEAVTERRAQYPTDPSAIPSPGAEGASWAGPAVTESTAVRHLDVYKCVNFVADSYAMLPWGAYRSVGDARVEVEPQPRIIRRPDPELDPFEWRFRAMTSLLLRGNSYSVITARDRFGVAQALHPIHPDEVRRITRGDDGTIRYELSGGETLGHFRQGGDMFHIRGFTVPGSLVGLSPIEAARQQIAASIATDEFGARWFGDGATPSAILKPEVDPGEAGARRLKREWVNAHGRRHREPAVLAGVEYEQIQVSPEESQFLETRKFNTAQIASLYRVPPHMVGSVERSTSWGTGIEEQGLGYVTYTLGAWIVRFESAVGDLLPAGEFMKHTVDALMRGRARDRMFAYAMGRQWGWLSVNDIRALEELPPIDDGDVYLQPLNMLDAGAATEFLLGNEDDNSEGANDEP